MVVRTLPANPTAQKIAANIPIDKPLASGLAIIKIPLNPTQMAKNLRFVNVYFKNSGAIKATHNGAVNSNANNWAKVI